MSVETALECGIIDSTVNESINEFSVTPCFKQQEGTMPSELPIDTSIVPLRSVGEGHAATLIPHVSTRCLRDAVKRSLRDGEATLITSATSTVHDSLSYAQRPWRPLGGAPCWLSTFTEEDAAIPASTLLEWKDEAGEVLASSNAVNIAQVPLTISTRSTSCKYLLRISKETKRGSILNVPTCSKMQTAPRLSIADSRSICSAASVPTYGSPAYNRLLLGCLMAVLIRLKNEARDGSGAVTIERLQRAMAGAGLMQRRHLIKLVKMIVQVHPKVFRYVAHDVTSTEDNGGVILVTPPLNTRIDSFTTLEELQQLYNADCAASCLQRRFSDASIPTASKILAALYRKGFADGVPSHTVTPIALKLIRAEHETMQLCGTGSSRTRHSLLGHCLVNVNGSVQQRVDYIAALRVVLASSSKSGMHVARAITKALTLIATCAKSEFQTISSEAKSVTDNVPPTASNTGDHGSESETDDLFSSLLSEVLQETGKEVKTNGGEATHTMVDTQLETPNEAGHLTVADGMKETRMPRSVRTFNKTTGEVEVITDSAQIAALWLEHRSKARAVAPIEPPSGASALPALWSDATEPASRPASRSGATSWGLPPRSGTPLADGAILLTFSKKSREMKEAKKQESEDTADWEQVATAIIARNASRRKARPVSEVLTEALDEAANAPGAQRAMSVLLPKSAKAKRGKPQTALEHLKQRALFEFATGAELLTASQQLLRAVLSQQPEHDGLTSQDVEIGVEALKQAVAYRAAELGGDVGEELAQKRPRM